jgi:hypothetical protein
MNALTYLENSELENAELDRETYEEPAITFQVISRLITTAGENGEEVPLDGSEETGNAGNGAAGGGS